MFQNGAACLNVRICWAEVASHSCSNLVFLSIDSFDFNILCVSRASSLVCCSPTQLGPKEFQWTATNIPNRQSTRPRRRQFSLQFSRQTSKSSVRSLPSPKGLGRRRRCLARFQSRRSPAPPTDTLQLPDPEQDPGFQGMTEGDESDRTNNSKDVKNNNSQSQSSGEKRESLT